MSLPAGFADTMHALTAIDAVRVRLDWNLGVASGARITLGECDTLHAALVAKNIDVGALCAQLDERTRRQHFEWAQKQAEKKAAKKTLHSR